ncbi:MAG: hypothetical protein ACRD2C_27140 [Acidimicrobiales bacterium]
MTDNARITTLTWTCGAVAWLAAALVGAGADDGSGRFYAAEAVWLVAHTLLLTGFVALRRLDIYGQRRLGHIGFGLAIAGRLAFFVAEIVALATGKIAEPIMPVAVLLSVAGMTLAGTAIARQAAGDTWRRYSPLAMGLYPIVFMIPLAAATGEPPVAAIAGWALPTLAIGLAARPQQAPASPTATAAAPATQNARLATDRSTAGTP